MRTKKKIDFRSMLDIQTKVWDHPSKNKEQTSMLFCIATNIISKGLKELRNDSYISDLLKEGKAYMQQTRLKESRNKLIYVIANKDPEHIHRDSMGARIEKHMIQFTKDRKHIPVNIINTYQKVEGQRIRTCVVTVGNRDEKAAIEILAANQIEGLLLIATSFKRTKKKQWEQGIKQHEMVVKASTAVKVEGIDYNDIPEFRKDVFASKKAAIVDVAEANHARRTGVVYVQHAKVDTDAVRAMIQEILGNYGSAHISESDGSVKTTNTR